MGHLTIYGAGVFGLSIAWTALKRGATVTVIDPAGAGAGASGGVVGALQPHTPDPWNPKKQFQLDSLLMAPAFWHDIEETSGISSGYASVGRICPLATDREVELAFDRQKAVAIRWPSDRSWNVVRRLDGNWIPPSPTGYFLHDTLSAILNPARAVRSLAGAIVALGGQIKSDAEPVGDVIWATGWQGLLDLSTKTGTNAGNGVKGQAILLEHDASGSPQIYAAGLHIIPHIDGTVAIGSTSEREFSDPTVTDAALDDVLDRACGLMPILRGARVLRRWAGVRPRAKSRAPLLGPWPNRPGHFIANGGFKIGFGMAPLCAKVICDFVLEGKDGIPTDFHTSQLIRSSEK